MKYNEMMSSHFRSKPLIAEHYDPHRERKITIHYIGDDFLLGCSDGVDAWIIPCTSFPSLNLQEKLRTKSFLDNSSIKRKGTSTRKRVEFHSENVRRRIQW